MNPRFEEAQIAAIHSARIAGVRSGSSHRYTGVWIVVVEGRAFVRSWNDSPTGWFRAYLAEPIGSLSIGTMELRVEARRVRGERMRKAVTAALAEKYPTKGSEKWVRGFAEPQREKNTLELIPL